MSRYSKETSGEHMARIRALLVKDSTMSIRRIQEAMTNNARNPLTLQPNYIGKLINKIRKARQYRLDHYTMNDYLGAREDEIEEMKKRMWAIMDNPLAKDSDKVAATRALNEASNGLFEKMFDAGVFERQIGKIKEEHAFSEDERKLIDQALSYATRKTNNPTGKNIDKPGVPQKPGA
jgi:hypothetical protein